MGWSMVKVSSLQLVSPAISVGGQETVASKAALGRLGRASRVGSLPNFRGSQPVELAPSRLDQGVLSEGVLGSNRGAHASILSSTGIWLKAAGWLKCPKVADVWVKVSVLKSRFSGQWGGSPPTWLGWRCWLSGKQPSHQPNFMGSRCPGQGGWLTQVQPRDGCLSAGFGLKVKVRWQPGQLKVAG